jgi:hypothetical protein
VIDAINNSAPATAPTVPGLDTRSVVPVQNNRTRRPIEVATELAMEGQSANEAGRLILFNPSPEVDSLAEEVAALERYGVPRTQVRVLLARIGKAIQLNRHEHGTYRGISGALGKLIAVDATPSLSRASTVRGVYALLREPLGLLSRNAKGELVDGQALVDAASLVKRVAALAPREVLESPALPKMLGRRKFAHLWAAVEAQDQKAAP